jgi:hypothetical protein
MIGRRITPLIAVLLAAACETAAPRPGTPAAQAPPRAQAAQLVLPPPGSTWVIEQKSSGSYGVGSQRLTIRALPETTYQGRRVRVFDEGETTLYVDATTGGWVARLRGRTVIESFEPPLGWDFPIWPGKRWVRTYAYSDPEYRQTFTVTAGYKVDAYEDVTVPAGRFKAYKVSYDSPAIQIVSWWEPQLGIFVKDRSMRREHYLGVGTSETALVSHSIRR